MRSFLLAASFITRTRDSADERRILIELTAAGRKLKARASPISGCTLEAAQCSLTELTALTKQVKKLRDHLKT